LVTYKIYRCNQVPFGLAAVRLEVRLEVPRTEIDIQLKLEDFVSAGQPLSSSHGPKDRWTSLELATEQQLQRLAKERPNWRVWTWSDADKTYKVWAEFGGTVSGKPALEEHVLLWDDSRNERRIPVVRLSTADKQWIKQGRFWAKGTKPRLVLMEIIGGDQLQLGRFDENENKVTVVYEPHPKAKLHHADQAWFSRHLASKRTAKSDDWEGFATYIR
jgi:hypothetical protein